MKTFRSWLITGISLIGLIGCANHTIDMPAITDTATEQHLPGKIIWHDLISDTPTQSQHFYTTLLGWTFETVPLNDQMNYRLIRNKGQLIGGMVDQTQLRSQADISQWMPLMATDDIEASIQTVSAQGGKIIAPPTDVLSRGKISVIEDPQGALMALLQTKWGDPADREPVPGDFLWNELWTSDQDSATHFYQSLTQFTIDDHVVAAADEHRYRILKSQDTPRLSIIPNPVEDLDPVWVSYILVENAAVLEAMVAQVEGLGGKVLLPPQDRLIGGKVALIADPSGAGIALQTWPKTPSTSSSQIEAQP